jgi:hypothetical protein
MRKALPPVAREEITLLLRPYCFLVESLDEPEVEPLPDWPLDELEPDEDGVDADDEGDDGDEDDGEAVLPLPDEDDDGEDGVAEGLLLLDEDDGEVMLPLLEPEVEPAPLRSAPRSHATIRLAPRATETATARVENFMLPP